VVDEPLELLHGPIVSFVEPHEPGSWIPGPGTNIGYNRSNPSVYGDYFQAQALSKLMLRPSFYSSTLYGQFVSIQSHYPYSERNFGAKFSARE